MYGVGNNSYKAAGELAGLNTLVDRFYHYMCTLPEAQSIRKMHSDDLTLSKQKLSYFLSGWLGGPKIYAEHFGNINIPKDHSHLPVNESAKNAWLLCMQKAVDEQPYDAAFKIYLMAQFAIPAERIKQVAVQKQQTTAL